MKQTGKSTEEVMKDIARERGCGPAAEEQTQAGTHGESKVTSYQIADVGDGDDSDAESEQTQEQAQAGEEPAAASAAGAGGEVVDLGVRVSTCAAAAAGGGKGSSRQLVAVHLEPDEAAGCVQVNVLAQ